MRNFSEIENAKISGKNANISRKNGNNGKRKFRGKHLILKKMQNFSEKVGKVHQNNNFCLLMVFYKIFAFSRKQISQKFRFVLLSFIFAKFRKNSTENVRIFCINSRNVSFPGNTTLN